MVEDGHDQIVLERQGKRGRYSLAMPDGGAAELTFTQADDRHIVVEHTFVPPRHRGGGVAIRLVLRAVADARAAGATIMPACGYVAAEFRRHPEWNDVLKQ